MRKLKGSDEHLSVERSEGGQDVLVSHHIRPSAPNGAFASALLGSTLLGFGARAPFSITF